MDPMIIRERMGRANARIAARAETIAGHPLDVQPINDPQLAALLQAEAVADLLDSLELGEGGVVVAATPSTSPLADVTADDLRRARLASIPRLSEERQGAILDELGRTDAPEPLRDRLMALDGVGERTADAVLEQLEAAGLTTVQSVPLAAPAPTTFVASTFSDERDSIATGTSEFEPREPE